MITRQVRDKISSSNVKSIYNVSALKAINLRRQMSTFALIKSERQPSFPTA
jgi:hypothetical protein